jgi:lipoprotein-anchoring transpeptidase ErfK/SrfK
MISHKNPPRLASKLALAILAASAFAASAQSIDDAAEAAETVAARAERVIERVDPTTLGPSNVVNPGLANPYAATLEDPIEAELIARGLPPLDDETTYADAPRGPATRMIANEVVQPLPPAPVITPAAAPGPAPARQRAASNDPFVIKSILPIEGTIRYGEWFWDESNAPATGKMVVTVDLDARVISVFRDGHEIGTAVALLGTTKHPTPLGTFPILRKNREYFSRKYNNAPMPHSLWLTNTGIAIHGSPVSNGYASHGCIGVPDPFAAKLFDAVKQSDKVIITRGKMIGVGDKVL